MWNIFTTFPKKVENRFWRGKKIFLAGKSTVLFKPAQTRMYSGPDKISLLSQKYFRQFKYRSRLNTPPPFLTLCKIICWKSERNQQSKPFVYKYIFFYLRKIFSFSKYRETGKNLFLFIFLIT